MVDLELNPPRITDRVVVGDGPEGLAISPKGDVAVAIILGNYLDQDLSILRVNGTKITPVKRFKLSGHPASIRMSTHALSFCDDVVVEKDRREAVFLFEYTFVRLSRDVRFGPLADKP